MGQHHDNAPLSSLKKTKYCPPTVHMEKDCKPCEPEPPKKEFSHCDDAPCDPCDGRYNGSYGRGGNWFLNLVIWFIVIAVIVWFILVSTKPTWVQKNDDNGVTTGEVDQGKAILWAVIIALIITAVIWIVRYGIRM